MLTAVSRTGRSFFPASPVGAHFSEIAPPSQVRHRPDRDWPPRVPLHRLGGAGQQAQPLAQEGIRKSNKGSNPDVLAVAGSPGGGRRERGRDLDVGLRCLGLLKKTFLTPSMIFKRCV